MYVVCCVCVVLCVLCVCVVCVVIRGRTGWICVDIRMGGCKRDTCGYKRVEGGGSTTAPQGVIKEYPD